MKVYRKIPAERILEKSVISIGSFDGMHLGHQEILKSTIKHSEGRFKSLIVTFFPTPQSFFNKDFKGYLSSKKEKVDAIKDLGIDRLCMLEFNSKLKDVSAEDFLTAIVHAFNPSVFIVGYNHFFGKNKKGDLDFLRKYKKKYSFKVIKVDKVINQKIGISSSRIRKLLELGNVKKAAIALGRKYSLNGLVFSGKGLGKKIGFPTANLDIGESKIIPGKGVYYIEAFIGDDRLFGMCNIGFNPTVNNKKSLKVEVHLFDFNKNIYGKELKIKFVDFIRKERKFKDISSLKEQLAIDKNKCLEYSLYNV